MTYDLSRRHDEYFRPIKEETVTDKNRNISENKCNEKILKEDLGETNVKQTKTLYLDDRTINDKTRSTSTIESHYDGNNIVEENNIYSLENYFGNFEIVSKTDQSPLKEDISFKNENKRLHTVDTLLNRGIYNESELIYASKPSPVPVSVSEIYNSDTSTIREHRTSEKTAALLCKTVVSNSSFMNERKDKTDSPMPVFISNDENNKSESNSLLNSIKVIKKCEDKCDKSKPVSISSTLRENKEDSMLQEIQKLNSSTDEVDFFLSLEDPIKKQSSASIHQKSRGK